jgi:hypothetical protein
MNIRKEFEARHDFEDGDLQILKNKYPNTNLKQIPIAWIIEIDSLLAKVYSENPNAISTVKQECGLLCVSFRNNQGKKYAKLVEKTLKRLQNLDKDLYEQQEYDTKVKAILRH